MRLQRDAGNTKGGKYHSTVDLQSDWFGISCITTERFCFYLQNRLNQLGQTGGQWYSDTPPFSIPWMHTWQENIDMSALKHFYHH
jgi:hypothetical protein